MPSTVKGRGTGRAMSSGSTDKRRTDTRGIDGIGRLVLRRVRRYMVS